MAAATIRQLRPDDARSWVDLRLRALREEPQAFISSYAEYQERPNLVTQIEERFRRLDQATFGAFVGGQLLGMATFVDEGRTKQAHIGELVGMYVSPEARGRGIGRSLVQAVLAAARGAGKTQVELAVADTQAAAKGLYAACGFVAWGTQPRGMQADGAFIDLHFMACSLPLDEGQEASPVGNR
jgi:L-amino acid N-acyltransferase YncA